MTMILTIFFLTISFSSSLSFVIFLKKTLFTKIGIQELSKNCKNLKIINLHDCYNITDNSFKYFNDNLRSINLANCNEISGILSISFLHYFNFI